MAWETPGHTVTRVAAADLTGAQYRALVLTNVSQVNQAGTAGTRTYGVLQNKPASGKAATVMLTGETKMVAGAAITLPARITTDAQGRAITATTSGHFVLGEALQAAAAAGQVITVSLYAEPTVS